MIESRVSFADGDHSAVAIPAIRDNDRPVAPIRLVGHVRPFHLSNLDVPHAQALFEFIDRNGDLKQSFIAASVLYNERKFKDHFADRFFDWSAVSDPSALIKSFRNDSVSTDGYSTCVPGWHDSQYSRGMEWFAPEGKNPRIHFQETQSVKLGRFLKAGSADAWRKKIGSYAEFSSRIRLFIALPFAATILKLVDASPFGVVLVGPSSIGKSLMLQMAASVMGHLGPEDLTTLGSTMPAIREMILGHRDGVLPLDEVGEIAGDEKRLQEFLKQLSFLAGKTRTYERASVYENAVGAVKADTRVIMVMASEVSLASIAKSSGRARLRGEEVRIIELPAMAEGHDDVFDGLDADERIGSTVRERSEKVKQLSKRCAKYQGEIHAEFLRALMRDGLDSARRKLKDYIESFLKNAAKNAALLGKERSYARIIELFAVIYAGARLAIEYRVLNWNAAATGNAIMKCLAEVLRHMEVGSANTRAKNEDELASEFLLKLSNAEACSFEKGDRTSAEYQRSLSAADAFERFGRSGKLEEILLKAERMRQWFRDGTERTALVKALQARKLLVEGRDSTTATRQVRVPSLGQARTSFYVLIPEVLPSVRGKIAQGRIR